MSITTEDCKKFLSEIYETQSNNWKRTKKYKIGDVWFRDFENDVDDYKATLKEKNGQLFLVPKEVLEKSIDSTNITTTSFLDAFNLGLGANIDVKVCRAECRDSVLEESSCDVGIGPALHLDGNFLEQNVINHLQSSMDNIFGNNFVKAYFSYGALMFDINRTDGEEEFAFAEYLDSMMVFPFILDALNVNNSSDKQKFTNDYIKDLMRHVLVENSEHETFDFDGFGVDGYLYRNDKKLCKTKDMTWFNKDLVSKYIKYADPVIFNVYEKIILNQGVNSKNSTKKGKKI